MQSTSSLSTDDSDPFDFITAEIIGDSDGQMEYDDINKSSKVKSKVDYEAEASAGDGIGKCGSTLRKDYKRCAETEAEDDVTCSRKTTSKNNNKDDKKSKQMCVYKSEWQGMFPWVKEVKENKSRAFCSLCSKDFGIAHGGKHDVMKHSNTEDHKRRDPSDLNKASKSVSAYFAAVNSTEMDKVSALF